MDSTIVAALISAAASVVVALLGRPTTPVEAVGQEHSARPYTIPERNRKVWRIGVWVLLA